MTNYFQRPTPQQIQQELSQFIGTQHYYLSHLLPQFVYTDGIKHMAEICQAYWLIDAILSYQLSEIIRSQKELQEFQVWKLEVNQDNDSAILSCEDGNKSVILTQEIESTDFPLKEFSCYLINKILLLTSEY